MAKKGKVKHRKTGSGISSYKQRNENTRSEKPRIIIFCEGEKTEPYYFKALKTEIKSDLISVIIYGCGKGTSKLFEEAQKKLIHLIL